MIQKNLFCWKHMKHVAQIITPCAVLLRLTLSSVEYCHRYHCERSMNHKLRRSHVQKRQQDECYACSRFKWYQTDHNLIRQYHKLSQSFPLKWNRNWTFSSMVSEIREIVSAQCWANALIRELLPKFGTPIKTLLASVQMHFVKKDVEGLWFIHEQCAKLNHSLIEKRITNIINKI